MGYQERPCPFCDGSRFAWGDVRSDGISFQSDESGFWDRLVKFGYRLRARRCETCGNLQLFDEPGSA